MHNEVGTCAEILPKISPNANELSQIYGQERKRIYGKTKPLLWS